MNGNTKILIAEDDMTSRAMLRAVLAKWGYDVTAAMRVLKTTLPNPPAFPI